VADHHHLHGRTKVGADELTHPTQHTVPVQRIEVLVIDIHDHVDGLNLRQVRHLRKGSGNGRHHRCRSEEVLKHLLGELGEVRDGLADAVLVHLEVIAGQTRHRFALSVTDIHVDVDHHDLDLVGEGHAAHRLRYWCGLDIPGGLGRCG